LDGGTSFLAKYDARVKCRPIFQRKFCLILHEVKLETLFINITPETDMIYVHDILRFIKPEYNTQRAHA
jgi:hypothetical protein